MSYLSVPLHRKLQLAGFEWNLFLDEEKFEENFSTVVTKMKAYLLKSTVNTFQTFGTEYFIINSFVSMMRTWKRCWDDCCALGWTLFSCYRCVTEIALTLWHCLFISYITFSASITLIMLFSLSQLCCFHGVIDLCPSSQQVYYHKVVSIISTKRVPVQRAALSGMKCPTRESPARDAASPISTTNLVAITVEPSTGRQ